MLEKEMLNWRETKYIENFSIAQIVPSTVLPHRNASQQIIESIKNEGVKFPLKITDCLTNSEKKEIIDGHERYFAITTTPEITITEVPVLYTPNLTKEEIFEQAHSSFTREDWSPFYRGEMYQKMMEQMNITQVQLSLWLKSKGEDVTQETINNYIQIVQLKPLAEKYRYIYNVRVTDLMLLATLKQHPQDLNDVLQNLDLRRDLDGGLTSNTIKDFVKKKQTEIETRVFKEIAPQLPIPPPSEEKSTDKLIQELASHPEPMEKVRDMLEENEKPVIPVKPLIIPSLIVLRKRDSHQFQQNRVVFPKLNCPKCKENLEIQVDKNVFEEEK